ncbi:AMP-binding protein [Desulfohalovibrio reitneri]|uniref:AMP-binding protein n=1 Tax=Desulfohalovibrio reitneri TaxID=1307759 RepID=UPI0004A735E2|nr:AMP-binding protein [Desulfohalovibrio reitneri]
MSRDFETLPELVRALGEARERDMLVWFDRDGKNALSCAKGLQRAEKLARGLAARGMGPGDRLALFADNAPETVLLVLAATLCGAVAMPVDPQLSGDTLVHVLRDGAPSLILANKDQAARVADLDPAPEAETLRTDTGGEGSWAELERDGEAERDLPRVSPGDTAALFYTSGTTGPPKGVPLTHANLAYQQRALIRAQLVRPGLRMLLPLPLHHVYPFVVGVFTPLALGLPVILPGGLTGQEVVRAVREGGANIIIGVPRLYQALLSGLDSRLAAMPFPVGWLLRGAWSLSTRVRRAGGPRLGKALLYPLHRRIGPGVSIAASGGAPLEEETAWRLEGLGWKVVVGYGLTETSPILTVIPPGAGRFRTVGRPLEETSLRIGRAPDAPKGAGEVQAKGPGVFSGYRNLPDKTREAFTGDGWYRTGDLGRLEDGWLSLAGRASTLLVTPGGENVQPETVEAALDRHRLIKESGVLEHEGAIKALLVADAPAIRQGGDPDLEKIARSSAQEAARDLPSHHRPTEYRVTTRPLERTRLGKIRRHKLEERFEEAGREDAGADLTPMDPADMDPADRELLEDGRARAAWDLLAERFPKRGLRPDSDLAGELGLDSLAWLDLSLELSQRTGTSLDEDAIARLETVRDLLREVASAKGGGRGADPVREPLEYLTEEELAWIQPANGLQRGFHRAGRGLLRAAFTAYFRLEVKGLENLPTDSGPLVIASNHLSYLDAFVLDAALPFSLLRRTHFAGWTGAAFANPVFGFVSRAGQTFPVDPARRPGVSLALGAGVLARGRALVWFPEGIRSRDGSLQPFQPGLGRILAAQPARVVPARIHGTHQAMPPGSALIRPAKVSLRLGPALESSHLADEGEGNDEAERILHGLRARMEAAG